MKLPACLRILCAMLAPTLITVQGCERPPEELWSPGMKPTAYSAAERAAKARATPGPAVAKGPARPSTSGPAAAASKAAAALTDALVEHLGALQRAHRDGNEEAQKEALGAIKKLDRKGVEEVLLGLLKRNVQGLGTPAALAIGRLGFTSGLRPLSDRLLAEDVFLAQAAAEALGALGDKRAAPALVEVVKRHASPSVRAAALDSLTLLGERSVVPAVADSTKDPEPDVRAAAARLLTRLGAAKEHGERLQALLTDDAAQVRTAAALALTELRAPNALEALVKLLADRSEDARRAGTKALIAFPDRVSVRNKLIYALEHGDGAARLSYSQVLKQVCDCSCMGDITHLSKHSDNAFVRNAATTLAQDLVMGGCRR